MNLAYHIAMVEAGGPGSGCNPAAGKCGRPAGASSDEDVEKKLTSKPVTSSSYLDMEGANAATTRLVKLQDDGRGVFKTDEGKWNEVAAYEIAKAVGMGDLVPPTVMRTINGEEGSLQQFQEGSHRMKAGEVMSAPDLARAVAFDLMIGNLDRHGGNFLIGADGKLRLIDNGLAFSARSAVVAKDSHFLYMLASGKTFSGTKIKLTDLDNVPSPKSLAAAIERKIPEIKESVRKLEDENGDTLEAYAGAFAQQAVKELAPHDSWKEMGQRIGYIVDDEN
ncbi:MAG: hypothetical protein KGL39_30610 [Patescibacteria group bacterium]|nr:hypothetical protein [Patescibacteria group bacterium]